MKNGLKASVIGLMAASILAGCGSNNSQQQETKISKSELKEIVYKDTNLTGAVYEKYADSMQTNQNLTKPSAEKAKKFTSKTIKKLKNSEQTKTEKNVLKLNKYLHNSSVAFEESDFKEANAEINAMAPYLGKSRKALGINIKDKKLSPYRRSMAHFGKVADEIKKTMPMIDKKSMTVRTSDEKIQFTSAQIVPGYEGKSTILVYYNATNLSDEPQDAYSLMLDAGDWQQDDGDSYKDLDMGIVDSDWEDAHPDYEQLDKDSSESKLKPKTQAQGVAVLELANNESPLLFNAKDEESDTKLGTIKIPLNYNNQ